MKNFNSIAPVLALIAFIYYALMSMTYSFTMEVNGISRTSIIELIVIALSLFSMLTTTSPKSSFYKYWIIWIIWIAIIFLIGLGGTGMANIIHVVFCPMCFVLFYNCSIDSNDFNKASIVTAVALFLACSYKHIIYSNALTGLLSSNVFATSNFIYWPLCCTPFLFCVEKKYLKYLFLFLLVLDVVISQKRAPLIAVSILLVVFFLKETTQTKHLSRLLIFFFIVAGFFVLSQFFSGYVEQLIGRVNMIQEDEGSGRVPLWNDVINSLGGFDIVDVMLGKGYGSIKLTGHTNAHNDGLQMLYEYGIVGLFFYIALIWLFLKRCILLYRKRSKYFYGYFSAIVIILVMGAVSNLTISNNYFAFICAFAGFVEAQIYVRKDFHESYLH